ncbi:hypothetical protein [Arthrobacter sp. GCM10027362]|uniref:hypothetical protein n=1 Tax=Arthrobacter sp. GCM10027362 TaxID=3273379 RepID=UPI0036702F4E
MKTPSRWHRTTAGMAVLVLSTGTACAGPQPELTDAAAERMQSRAAAVRTAAAGGEYEDALTALDGLTGELTRAAGQGQVSFPRYQSIQAAVTQLRLDLNARLKHARPKAASPTPAAPSASPGPPAPSGPDAPAVPSPLPATAEPLPQPAAPERSKENRGKGGSGNGKAGQSNGKEGKGQSKNK